MKIFKSEARNKKAQKISNASFVAMAASGLLSMSVSQFFKLETAPTIILVAIIPIAIFFVPLLWFAWKSNREAWAQEKREQQAKEDAEDKAMFGKPLRELKIDSLGL